MDRTGGRTLVAALLAASALAACAEGPALASPPPAATSPGAAEPPSGAPSVAADAFRSSTGPETDVSAAAQQQVQMRVAFAGGFSPGPLGSVPEASVYTDRRVITADPVEGAAPALAPLSVRMLDAAAMQRLRQAAVDAGLAEGSYTDPPSPDARSVTIAVRHDGTDHRSSFTSLSPQQGDSPEVAQRRAGAAEFVGGLRELERHVGPDGVSAPEPFTPERVAVAVRPAAGEASEARAAKAWPTEEVRLAELAGAGACLVLDGARAAAVVGALAGEDAVTLWRQDGEVWQVLARPLLPDQRNCR